MSSCPNNKQLKQYKKTCLTISNIQEKYESIEILKSSSDAFRKSKLPHLKKAYSDYLLYYRCQKKKLAFEKDYIIETPLSNTSLSNHSSSKRISINHFLSNRSTPQDISLSNRPILLDSNTTISNRPSSNQDNNYHDITTSNQPISLDCQSSMLNQVSSTYCQSSISNAQLSNQSQSSISNTLSSNFRQSSILNQHSSNHCQSFRSNQFSSNHCESISSNQSSSNHHNTHQDIIPLNQLITNDISSSISNHPLSNSRPHTDIFISNEQIGQDTTSLKRKNILPQDFSPSILYQDNPSSHTPPPQDVIITSSQMNPASNFRRKCPHQILDSDEETISQSDNEESIDSNPIDEHTDNTQQHQQTNNTRNEEEFFDSCCCDNCQRRQSAVLCNENEAHSPYRLSFIETTTLYVNCRRKFKFVPSTQNEDNASNIILCKQCHNHLTTDNMEVAKDMKNCWPGFIWGILNDENIQSVYGDAIWRFLPHQWRLWWLDSCQFYIPSLLNITLDHPTPFIVDITIKIQEWNLDYQSKMLPRLANTCNKYLMPNILCPWGCSEYIHK